MAPPSPCSVALSRVWLQGGCTQRASGVSRSPGYSLHGDDHFISCVLYSDQLSWRGLQLLARRKLPCVSTGSLPGENIFQHCPELLCSQGNLSTREPGSLSLGQGPEIQGRSDLSRSPQHAGFVAQVLSSVLPMTLPGVDHCLPEPGGPMALTVRKPGLAHGYPRQNCQPLPRYTGADWKCLFLYAVPRGRIWCHILYTVHHNLYYVS